MRACVPPPRTGFYISTRVWWWCEWLEVCVVCDFLPDLVDSLDCIERACGGHELVERMDIEDDGELYYLVACDGCQGVDRESEVVCYLAHDVNEEMVAVDATDEDAGRIDGLGVGIEVEVNDIVSLFRGEAYGLGTVAPVECYGAVVLPVPYGFSSWQWQAYRASVVLLVVLLG